ncbi:uncharacterized protein LOC132741152, partial [Ruditapes philippinarum]|uniref:uncharacterized protein LOC132741152 n=1 Tax=Ruditapes philippinarum TaxID=129788 RepID=UPI00295ADF1F
IFLSELSCIVSGETDDDVDELLQRYDIDDLDIAEEELWMVEAPVLPGCDTPEEAEEEGEVSGEDDDINVTVASQDGEFQLRMWPPVASENKIHVTEGTEKPTSNIWPPPQAKDYMKSVKDLPSNIRMIVHKQTETQEDDDKATQPSTEIESSRTEQELKTYPVHQSDFERATGLVEDSKSQGAGGQLKLVSAGKLDDNVGALQLEHSKAFVFILYMFSLLR